MKRIFMTTPLVETDGDGVWRIWWRRIKDELIWPFVELEAEYYDLSREKRRATGGRIVAEAEEAQRYYGVAVQCEAATAEGLILAWADAFGKRGKLDGLRELEAFADALRCACREAAEEETAAERPDDETERGCAFISKVGAILRKTGD